MWWPTLLDCLMSDPSRDTTVVFGASGALGSAVVDYLSRSDGRIIQVTRQGIAGDDGVSLEDEDWASSFGVGSVTAVVWAQGVNAAGGILDDGPAQIRDLFEANVMFVVETLRAMLDEEAVAHGARLVIVSSVWQSLARDHKLAYVTSKSAIAGLVRSLIADLGARRIRVNAVLPGVVDSPMTREYLSEEQIHALEGETPGGRLVSSEEVAAVCSWLASESSSGVNGQFITVDSGWSEVRRV